MSEKFKKIVVPVVSSLAIVLALASPSLATAGSGGSGTSDTGVDKVEAMVTDLDGVADDAIPIAIGVTGFAVAVLLVKRALYA